MRCLRIFALALLWIGQALAQPSPDTLWTRTYGGTNSESANSIRQTTEGGFVIAGNTLAGGNDIYMVKTNSNGDTIWTRTYGGTGAETAWSVQQTTDHGYVLAGHTNSYGAGSYDFYVVKTSSNGDTLWTRTYGGSSLDIAYFIQHTTDGGYVIAGRTQSFGAGSNDIYVVKTNSNGSTVWTRTYGGSNNEAAYSIQQTTDGGYVIAGYTQSFGAGGSDIYVVKTNGSGDTLWTRTYGGINADYANSIQQTEDGGYVIAGPTASFGAGGNDFYVVKTNSSGDTLWTRTYGGIGDDQATSVQQTSDGGYVVAGYTTSFGAGGYDFYVVKIDHFGGTVWTRTYGGSGTDRGNSILQTTDSGYMIAGTTTSFGAGGSDCYVVKTGADVSDLSRPRTPLVVITISGSDARLNWNRITQTIGGNPITVPDYLVFYAPTSQGPFYYHGYTADTTYTHFGVVRNAAGMYYNVMATTVPQTELDGIERGEEMESVREKIRIEK